MKNNYRIVFTDSAALDLDNIYLYIKDELQNDLASIQLVTEIENSVLRLKEFPHSCSFVDDQRLRDKDYRKLLVNNFIVLYTTDDMNNIVTVVHIVYGRQNYIDFL